MKECEVHVHVVNNLSILETDNENDAMVILMYV